MPEAGSSIGGFGVGVMGISKVNLKDILKIKNMNQNKIIILSAVALVSLASVTEADARYNLNEYRRFAPSGCTYVQKNWVNPSKYTLEECSRNGYIKSLPSEFNEISPGVVHLKFNGKAKPYTGYWCSRKATRSEIIAVLPEPLPIKCSKNGWILQDSSIMNKLTRYENMDMEKYVSASCGNHINLRVDIATGDRVQIGEYSFIYPAQIKFTDKRGAGTHTGIAELAHGGLWVRFISFGEKLKFESDVNQSSTQSGQFIRSADVFVKGKKTACRNIKYSGEL